MKCQLLYRISLKQYCQLAGVILGRQSRKEEACLMKTWLFQPEAEGSKQSVLTENTNTYTGYEIPRRGYTALVIPFGTQPMQRGESHPTFRRSILPSSKLLKS
jgi:hypothetical protein